MELPSNDGVHKLHVVVWQPNGEPKAVLQLSHGMIEFIERYEGLAQYLNEQDKDTGSDAEKFSTYLHKLDQSHAITEDEREAYIGIYRLFR